ncbi:MAG: tRNA (adenosine(37)-N6)-threonylcarbamoyltransferase complex dimerization subunit type 1 TsaB [Rhodospirillales bacterium]|nr:tRNA (adenosine(37)-N6)-threonylcarbamoyltransferase complex dimerization subunit type 1 TsaB [Rhodospirillales bacterium]
MRILAIDTATGACSVALRRDGRPGYERFAVMPRGHAEALMPMVLGALDAEHCDFSALDLIAVTVGPGGFTGLRVGLATARGIALAAGIPCLGVTTLESIADAAAITEGRLLVALDSKRGDLYVQAFGQAFGQAFEQGAPMAAPQCLSPLAAAEIWANRAEHGSLHLAGNGAAALAEALRAVGTEGAIIAGTDYPRAACVAACAERRWLAGERPTLPPAPLYLAPPATGPATRTQGGAVGGTNAEPPADGDLSR